jgi:hypothetical protein
MNTPIYEQVKTIAMICRKFSDQEYNTQYGSDCVWQALIAEYLFKELYGTEVKVCYGYAGWQASTSDTSPLVHDSRDFEWRGRKSVSANVRSILDGWTGHAWIEIGDMIFDPTLWQLRYKLSRSDMALGLNSKFASNKFGEYLWTSKRGVFSNAKAFLKHSKKGTMFYERDLDVEKELDRTQVLHTDDEEPYLEIAKKLIENKNTPVIVMPQWALPEESKDLDLLAL